MPGKKTIKYQVVPARDICYVSGDEVTIGSGVTFAAKRIFLFGSAKIIVEQGAKLYADIFFCSDGASLATKTSATFAGILHGDGCAFDMGVYTASHDFLNIASIVEMIGLFAAEGEAL